MSVTDLAPYAVRRGARLSAATRLAEKSQSLYERITARAEAARRRDFKHALEQGLGVDEIAEAAGLEAEDVWPIVGGGD
jgi:Ni,Fe-hydrogenase III large subunit